MEIPEDEETMKKLVTEMVEYERRFFALLTDAKICSILLDRKFDMLFVNRNFLDFTGYTQEEVVGLNFVNDLLIPEKREPMKNVYSMMFCGITEALSYTQGEILAKDGTKKMICWNHTVHKDPEGNIVAINCTGEEPTAKKDGAPTLEAIVKNPTEEKPRLSISSTTFTGDMIGDYILVKPLGGENVNVKLAIHKKTKEKVAVKTLKKENMTEQELERAKREVDIMQQLTKVNNPYIIKLLDVMETPEEFHIFVEYIAGGELVAYILKKKGLTEAHTHQLFTQILSAIECCHNHSIIHRDIKLQNILLVDEKEIKLIDFGLSNFVEDGVFRSTFCGTPAYASPEILLGTKYNGPEVDLWSLGVVLYSMLTAEFPFTTIGDILKGKFKEPQNITPECGDLLRRMLKVEKADRETLVGVLNHPWVKMTDVEIEAKSQSILAQLETKQTVEETEPPSKRRKPNELN